MAKENISQESRLKNIEEIKNFLIEEINQNELMSKKHKKVCTVLHYIEPLLILTSAVNGCLSIFAFASLVGISIRTLGIAVWIKMFSITAWIKMYKLMIKKKKKRNMIK